MPILRVVKNRENPYLVINTTAINDGRLSWKAKGLHAYLMSKPDDWHVYLSELTRHSTDKRVSTSEGIHELERCAYIVKHKVKNKSSGKFEGWEYYIFEQPHKDVENQQPKADFPTSVFPTSGNQPLLNIDKVLSNDINQIKEDEGEGESDTLSHSFPSVVELYRENFGEINPVTKVELENLVREHGPEQVEAKIKDAAGRGDDVRQKLPYIRKSLQSQGKEEEKSSAARDLQAAAPRLEPLRVRQCLSKFTPHPFEAETPAGRYYLQMTGKTRWANKLQKEKWESVESQVGEVEMRGAIEWALTTGIHNIDSILTAAQGYPVYRGERGKPGHGRTLLMPRSACILLGKKKGG